MADPPRARGTCSACGAEDEELYAATEADGTPLRICWACAQECAPDEEGSDAE